MKLILDLVNDLISESKSDDKIIIKALNLLLANYKDHLSLMDY